MIDADSYIARTRVLAQLAAAFDGVRLEDGVSLHEADAIDDYASDEERAKARALDTAVDWREVPAFDLERMHWVWSFLDAKGFRFYLPAALTWWIGELPDSKSDGTTMCSVLWKLHRRHKSRSIFEEHVRLLTHDQLAAVLACLEWIGEYDSAMHNDARRAAKSIRRLLPA